MMTVYLTYKQSDMTEGRGPMIPDRAFTTEKLAWEYANAQPGIMGRKGPWNDGRIGRDWNVEPVKVYDEMPDLEAEEREAIIKRLTPRERKLLGIS